MNTRFLQQASRGVGRRLWAIGLSVCFLTGISRAERAPNWRSYKMVDGLPESACAAVAVSSQGKILVRHANLPIVSELDGFSVVQKSLPKRGGNRIYQSPGGQLWTVAAEGLEEFKNGTWVRFSVPEIAAALRAQSVSAVDPVPLYPLRQGLLLFLVPSGLFEFNCEDMEHPRTRVLRRSADAGVGDFSGMATARDGGLWITGARGLARASGPVRSVQSEAAWSRYLLPVASSVTNLSNPHLDASGAPVALAETGTNHQRVLACFDGETWTFPVRTAEKIRQFWRGPDQTSWAITAEVLFQVDEARGEMRESEDISARQYYDVSVEPNGAFWLATSDGLYRYAPLLWSSPPGLRPLVSPINCLASDADGRIWFAAGNRVRSFQSGKVSDFSYPASLSRLRAKALFILKNGTVVLSGREGETASVERLYQLRAEASAFAALPLEAAPRNLRALGLVREGLLCVQNLSATGPDYALELYDGEKFEAFPTAPLPGSLGTNLAELFTTQKGDFWLSGDSGTAWYHDRKWHIFDAADNGAPAGAFGFIEMADGKIWCASGDVIWEFDGRNWSIVRRGFDRINDLQRSRDGSVWVASNNGLHRFFQDAWFENGVEDGLPSSSVRELLEDQRGQLWAATTRGLAMFHPEADPDPPRTSIEEITDTGGSVQPGGTVTLYFHGVDKWKYTSRESLLYSYRLDEHDWSPFQEVSQKSFTDMPAGKHVLQVRAMDRNGNTEPRAVREFAVVLPWYKETRLLLISSAGLIIALFFAGLAFNRHRQLLRSYAEVEQKVAERTHQLELASHELLHSQKMKALGTLAAGIAHDFNNILSIIKGSAQLIEDNLEKPEKIRLRAERIRFVVEQGSELVRAMLGFSRDSGQRASPCDLNMVVRDTLKLLGDRFSREAQVSFKPAADLPEALASRELVQQVLLNFIFNAVESMTDEKHVMLETRELRKLPDDLVLAPGRAGGYVSVSVRDTGSGISPENLARVFEPFFTTKAFSSRRGTGLGLSMVYELAKKLSGGLMVQSAVGQGSTFTLILPANEKPEQPQLEHEQSYHPHH